MSKFVLVGLRVACMGSFCTLLGPVRMFESKRLPFGLSPQKAPIEGGCHARIRPKSLCFRRLCPFVEAVTQTPPPTPLSPRIQPTSSHTQSSTPHSLCFTRCTPCGCVTRPPPKALGTLPGSFPKTQFVAWSASGAPGDGCNQMGWGPLEMDRKMAKNEWPKTARNRATEPPFRVQWGGMAQNRVEHPPSSACTRAPTRVPH